MSLKKCNDSASRDQGELGMVVNHFAAGNSEAAQRILEETTLLSIRFLLSNAEVAEVVLVDGSARPSPILSGACQELGVDYHHEGKEISYVRAYNIGWQKLNQPYIGLMANDIIPHPSSVISDLLMWIRKPGIGAVHPYFASNRTGGDETQRIGFAGRGKVSCEPATFTLNLNLFKRVVLEEIGGLDENYLFSLAEPILTVRIREAGFRVVMVGGAAVYHYDRLTKLLEESNLTWEMQQQDAARWKVEYERYLPKHLVCIDCALWRKPFSTTWMASVCWWLAMNLPGERLRMAAWTWVAWLEPWLTRFPAGKRRDRADGIPESLPIPSVMSAGRHSFSECLREKAIIPEGKIYADGWMGTSGGIVIHVTESSWISLSGEILPGEGGDRIVRVEGGSQPLEEEMPPGSFCLKVNLNSYQSAHYLSIKCDGDVPLAAPDTRRASLLLESIEIGTSESVEG